MHNNETPSSRERAIGVSKAQDITDVLEVSNLDQHTDTRSTIRLGARVLLIGFGCFLLWAIFAPLDEGVAAPATVSIETRKKTIQHLTGGVVKNVVVKEGQWVKTDDVLVELDDSVARANYESVRQTYLTQLATENRLMAELRGLDKVAFAPDLLKSGKDPIVQELMRTQSQLFASRRASLLASTSGLTHMLDERQRQASLQAQQLQSLKGLAEEGYASRNQVLQMEQSQAELRSTIAELGTNRARVQQEYLKEVSNQLADVQKEVVAGRDKLHAVTGELQRTHLRSPVNGQVVGLTLGSVGGVVSPGQKLMDIVPKGEALLIDARIPPHVIDKVYEGETVEVRFSTFANSPQLVVDARLTSVSSDVIVEQTPAGGMSYYLARIEITPDGLKQLGKRVIQPGMPTEVLIKTGERSMMTYLLHPLLKRIAASMKEE